MGVIQRNPELDEEMSRCIPCARDRARTGLDGAVCLRHFLRIQDWVRQETERLDKEEAEGEVKADDHAT